MMNCIYPHTLKCPDRYNLSIVGCLLDLMGYVEEFLDELNLLEYSNLSKQMED